MITSEGTEFGAYPDKVPLEDIQRIESELTNLRAIGDKHLFALMGEHPTLGTVLILNQDDDSGGFVFFDRVKFV